LKQPNSGPWRGWLIAAALSVALGTRLWHFAAISGTAFPELPTVSQESDMFVNVEWARRIKSGDWLGRDAYHPYFDWMRDVGPLESWHRWWGGKEVFQQAPLYPYWIAAVWSLIGESFQGILFVQLLLGVLQVFLVYKLSERAFGFKAGVVAGGLCAAYGPLIFHQGLLLRDGLTALLDPLTLWLLLRAKNSRTMKAFGAAGLGAGAATLAKETFALFLPLCLFWIWIESHPPRIRAWRPLTAFLAGCFIALSPLIARNILVGAPIASLSNRTAEALTVGNAADGFPIGMYVPPSTKAILETSDGKLWALGREILATYRGDWNRLIGHVALKARGLVDPFEVADNASFNYGREISPALRWSLTWGLLFPFGVTGVVWAFGRWREQSLLALYVFFQVAGILGTVVIGRYRLPLAIAFFACGSFGLLQLFGALRRRHWAPVATYGSLVLGLVIVQHAWAPIPEVRKNHRWAIDSAEHACLATAYAEQGRPDRAVPELERLRMKALRDTAFAAVIEVVDPLLADYRVLWADELLKQGKPAAARVQADLASAVYAAHPEGEGSYYEIGRVYSALGDTSQAAHYLERFLVANPDDGKAGEARRMLEEIRGQ
jgi:hypothetical protein